MIRKIWNQLAAKCVNRETVSYFIFGVLTTAVDWVGYFALYNMGYSVVFSQTMSWAAAVLFAFYHQQAVCISEHFPEAVKAL